MAIDQKNSYVVGSNNDLTNALLNIDLNRIGGDLTYLENDGGTLKVSVGSLIESQGSIYAVSGAAETPSGTAQEGAYLFFDDSVPEFVWSTTAGTYDPVRSGIYDGSNRRQCRFRLLTSFAWDVLIVPFYDRARFDGALFSVDNGIIVTDQLSVASDAAISGSLDLNGSLTPDSSPVADLIRISAGDTWTPIRGVYVVTDTTGSIYLEIYESGSWRRSDQLFAGGTVFADGSSVRFFNSAGTNAEVYYLKF
jgi:hypothetical protein